MKLFIFSENFNKRHSRALSRVINYNAVFRNKSHHLIFWRTINHMTLFFRFSSVFWDFLDFLVKKLDKYPKVCYTLPSK